MKYNTVQCMYILVYIRFRFSLMCIFIWLYIISYNGISWDVRDILFHLRYTSRNMRKIYHCFIMVSSLSFFYRSIKARFFGMNLGKNRCWVPYSSAASRAGMQCFFAAGRCRGRENQLIWFIHYNQHIIPQMLHVWNMNPNIGPNKIIQM